ncbi:MAG: hypothetical protein WCJ62_13655, partial [Flavobacterium sp.]
NRSAYNNPSLYYENYDDAQRAIDEFYLPYYMAAKLSGKPIRIVDIGYKHELGYYVTTDRFLSPYDSYWINLLQVGKKYYYQTLYSKFKAYNSCTKEYLVVFFKYFDYAENALHNFYEKRLKEVGK